MTSIAARLKRFQVSLPGRFVPTRGAFATLIGGPVDFTSRSEEARIAFRRGKILYWLGCYDEAICEFSRMLRLNWRDEKASIWIERVKQVQNLDYPRRVFQQRASASQRPADL